MADPLQARIHLPTEFRGEMARGLVMTGLARRRIPRATCCGSICRRNIGLARLPNVMILRRES